MDFLFGADMPLAVRFFVAFVIVLALIGGTAFLVRRFGGQRLGATATRGRQPRLAVIDAAAVDGRRRLILIRRDNVEHLLMIGGPSDIVVEANILRASAPSRDAGPRPAQAEIPPRAVTAAETTMWPSQPEMPAARAPRIDEPVLQWPVEPEPAPSRRAEPRIDASRSEPRAEPRAADPLAGLAAELSRVQPEPIAAPKMRPPRETARPVQPEQHAERSRAMPVADEPVAPPPNSDKNLADMAQRLEAALRRPRPGEQRVAEPPSRSAMAAPASEPMPEAVPVPMAPDAMVEAHIDEPPAAAPQPLAARRGASTKPAPQKSVYDSLEQEMASLLGRPNAKN
jgi:flagellar biogenesis protein FliO